MALPGTSHCHVMNQHAADRIIETTTALANPSLLGIRCLYSKQYPGLPL